MLLPGDSKTVGVKRPAFPHPACQDILGAESLVDFSLASELSEVVSPADSALDFLLHFRKQTFNVVGIYSVRYARVLLLFTSMRAHTSFMLLF